MSRLSYDEYFLSMAKLVGQRSTCPAKSVGAVLIDSEYKFVLGTGYNGAPRGVAHCGEPCANRKMGEKQKDCRAVHAELNAIFCAAFNGVKLKDSTLYVTISPCLSCARAIIQSGIKEVISSGKSPYDKALELLREAGVKVRIISGVGALKFRVSMVKDN